MGCDFPLKAYRPPGGVGRLVFLSKKGNPALAMRPIDVPCNQCRGCRLAKAQEWGLRCHHEAQFHERNSFITLTYDDDHLPPDFSVDPRTFELFLKRLRFSLGADKIRFFGCGEYGGKTFRPHYHAIIFGHDFPDKRKHALTKRGHPIFTSEALQKLWPYGFSSIGAVNWRTAAYTARYTLKKIGDDQVLPAGVESWDEVRNYRASHYLRIHPVTLKGVMCRPEFLRMSRMPGIGREWALQYKSDYFPSDFIVLEGKKFPVPKFYFNLLSPEEQKFVRDERRFEASSMLRQMERCDARRFCKREVRDARISSMSRDL